MPDHQVLILSHDVVGQHMAGPGIRYYHLARVLSQHTSITLGIPTTSSELPLTSFTYVHYAQPTWESLAPLTQNASVVITSNVLSHALLPLAGKVPVVIDGYDPLVAENLALSAHLPMEQIWNLWQTQLSGLQSQYQLGDFFICASERQRNWWLGLLEAHGRINPATVLADPSLRQLLDVVPFGLPTELPNYKNPIIKGVWPGITADDTLILWGGGLWPWLDPFTAIRAVAQLAPRWPQLRLVFPGTRHPNKHVAQDLPTHAQAAVKLATELGLLDKHVFFGDWIPYSDWGTVLLESDVALSLHFDTFETQLAFRSRVLEYIWAGLPIVATAGDATSDLVVHYQLGWTPAPSDVSSVADALWQAITQPPAANRFDIARANLTWERVAQPLIHFCLQPHFASDVAQRLLPTFMRLDEEQLRRELAQTRNDLAIYENGRVARTLRWLKTLAQRAGLPRA